MRKVSFVGRVGAELATAVGADPASVRWAMASGSGAGANNQWSVTVTQIPGARPSLYLEEYLASQRTVASIQVAQLGGREVNLIDYADLPDRWAFAVDDAMFAIEAPDEATAAKLVALIG